MIYIGVYKIYFEQGKGNGDLLEIQVNLKNIKFNQILEDIKASGVNLIFEVIIFMDLEYKLRYLGKKY